MRSRTSRCIFIGVGLIVGFVACLLCEHRSLIQFDGTITAGNIVQALSTLVASVVIAAIFQRLLQADRKEKDLILRSLDDFVNSVKELEKFKDGGRLTDITASLKNLSTQTKSIVQVLESLDYPKKVIALVKFDAYITKLRKVSTSTPIKELEDHAEGVADSVVKDGIIRLAAEKKALLSTTLQNLKNAILVAQIEINKV